MDFEEYLKFTYTTWNDQDNSTNLQHAMLGLLDELGEIAKCSKKVIGYNRKLDKDNLLEELGDYMYYLTRIVDCYKKMEVNLQLFCLQIDKEIKIERKGLQFETHVLCFSLAALTLELLEEISEHNVKSIFNKLLRIVELININSYKIGYNMNDVLSANMAKLKQRHKNKYNNKNLEERDYNKESKAIKHATSKKDGKEQEASK